MINLTYSFYCNTKSLIRIKVIEPAINPTNANHDIFFRYQKNSIFSNPIATTPAADPMISILPPVPAEKAIKCHSGWLVGSENIPILAATNGTLSMTAEPIPNNITTMSELGMAAFREPANSNNIPKDSKAATANNIPKKKRILGNSILDSELCTGL